LALVTAVVCVSLFVSWRLYDYVAESNEKQEILAGQVERMGGTPVVEPDEPIPPMVGERGPKGDRGDRGPRGPEGERGEPGDDGEDGARGPQGEPGKDGEDGKDGQDGQDGSAAAKGDPGPPGRGIASMECTDDGWIVTYTDGQSENAGDCRAQIIPPPAQMEGAA
jgi:hypothetical protein